MASLLTLATACGGAHGRSALPPGGTLQTTSAVLRIAIPKTSATSATLRAPKYVSPATQSMGVLVTQHAGGATVLSEAVGLTPTSTGCTSTLTSTQCTLALPLGPGTYDMTLTTYDGVVASGAATGSELSAGQTIAFTIHAGQANTVAVTLSGIPASISVFSNANAVRGTLTSGFTQFTNAPQKFAVLASDADGNFIIGSGAPAFTIASSGGTGFSLANPAPASPNTFSLTGQGVPGRTETFTATASYGDSTCSIAGAVCTASFTVTNQMQTLFVSNFNGNSVTVYPDPYAPPSVMIVNGVSQPTAIATDPSGNLFVGAWAGNALVFAPPYTGTPVTAPANGVYTAYTVMSGSDGTLFVTAGANAIAVPPPYTSATNITSSGSGLKEPSLDAAGDIFLPNQNSNTVTEFAPPYTGAPTTISNGINVPQQTLIDASGNLFVVNYGSSTVTEYAPPYTGAPIATLSSHISTPSGMAMDANGTVFVVSGFGVTIFTKPYTGTPVVISGNQPNAIAVDYASDVFLANLGDNTVTEYAPPYTGSPIATISGLSFSPNADWTLALYPR